MGSLPNNYSLKISHSVKSTVKSLEDLLSCAELWSFVLVCSCLLPFKIFIGCLAIGDLAEDFQPYPLGKDTDTLHERFREFITAAAQPVCSECIIPFVSLLTFLFTVTMEKLKSFSRAQMDICNEE